jgi:peptide/nickel transport system substrate-binding protein
MLAPFHQGYVSFQKQLSYNPTEANNLLDEAGWVKGPDGIRRKDGKELEITIAASSQSSAVQPAVEWLAQQWQKVIGVKVIDEAGNDTFYNAAGSSTKVGGKLSRSSLEDGLYSVFGPGNSTTLYNDPQLDALFAKDFAATSTAEIDSLTKQELQLVLVDKVYAIPLYFAGQVTGTSPKVHLTFTGDTQPYFQDAWVAGS